MNRAICQACNSELCWEGDYRKPPMCSCGVRAVAKPRKYRNIKVTVDGITFDSKKEAGRYHELRLAQGVGDIEDLEVHPVYRCEVNGQHVCKVILDFRYKDSDGNTIVEDVKAPPTRKKDVYRLKKKLLMACHGVEVTEV